MVTFISKFFYVIYFSVIFATTIYAKNMTKLNAYQFSFLGLNNEEINLADYKGKILLIVNTASKCGFTPQYQELEEIYQKYKKQGLVIISVPSADFAKQEFSDNSKIKDFTENNYQLTFPITTLEKIKGNNAHPFYLWARKEVGFIGAPKWNFYKYLIDKNGDIVSWYASTTKPNSAKIINKIEELLAN